MTSEEKTASPSPYLRLLAYARPYSRRFFLALGCMVAASACNVVTSSGTTTEAPHCMCGVSSTPTPVATPT